MKIGHGAKVSSFGMRVLKKMSTGQILSKTSEHDYRVGNLKVPPSLINEFKRIDLIKSKLAVQTSPERVRYLLSSVGEKFLKRALITNKNKSKNKRGEGVDVFLSQHRSMIKILRPGKNKGKPKKMAVNRLENPLGWLAGHKGKGGESFLSSQHLLAADRLRADFDKAGLSPRVTASFEGIPQGRRHNSGPRDLLPLEHQVLARRRYRGAIDAIGPGLADVLVRVCCYLEGLTDTEKALGWPNRSAKLVLRLALDRLVGHYDGAENT